MIIVFIQLNAIFTNKVQINSINLGWLIAFICTLITACCENMVWTSGGFLSLPCPCYLHAMMTQFYHHLFLSELLSCTLWRLLVSLAGTKYPVKSLINLTSALSHRSTTIKVTCHGCSTLGMQMQTQALKLSQGN